MESTAFGHAGEPKDGPDVPPVLDEFGFLNAGIAFESDGLRARIELTR
jgi:hypothetical protein